MCSECVSLYQWNLSPDSIGSLGLFLAHKFNPSFLMTSYNISGIVDEPGKTKNALLLLQERIFYK